MSVCVPAAPGPAGCAVQAGDPEKQLHGEEIDQPMTLHNNNNNSSKKQQQNEKILFKLEKNKARKIPVLFVSV